MTKIAVVSTTGPAAAREAMQALQEGNHVVLLSTGVTLTEEVELKREASQRELLLLGPGCGTSMVRGEGFGIWNSVRRGPIGVIGTTGSGVQELSCLADKVGISHALGIGPRDLSQKVGGAGALKAIEFLDADDKTKVIVMVARTPTTDIAHRVFDAVKNVGKPAVVCFLGGERLKLPADMTQAQTLEDAAAYAVAIARGKEPKAISFSSSIQKIKKISELEYSKFGYGQRYMRGLYSGGMLCTEAQVILRELIGPVRSNVPLQPRLRLPDPRSSRGHACVDMGAPELSGGRHPAVDPRLRWERLLKEARDWEAAVIMLDVVFGHGAHPDPAGGLAQTVEEAKRITDRGGGYLSVTASIIGTPRDPQNLGAQQKKLENAGVVVMPSNAQAVRMAALIATRGKIRKKL